MDFKVSYERTMDHSYLMIEANDYKETFEAEMLKNSIPGVLQMQIISQNEQVVYSYRITQKQSLTEYCKVNKFDAGFICRYVKSIIEQIRNARAFLLEPDNFIIQHELLYVGEQDCPAWICYYPGYQCSVKEQLSGLFEVWMKIIDYADQHAVKLVYELYHQCRKSTCTYDQLLEITEHTLDEISLPKASDSGSVTWEDDRIRKNCSDRIIAPEEELEDEQEVLYYPPKFYFIIGLSTAAGAAILFCLARTGILRDKYQQIDLTKTLGCIFLLCAVELYLVSKLFQKKNRLSRMVRRTRMISIHDSNQGMDEMEKETNAKVQDQTPDYRKQNQTASYDDCKELQREKEWGNRGTKDHNEIQDDIQEETTQYLIQEEETQLLCHSQSMVLIPVQEACNPVVIMRPVCIIGSSRRQADILLSYPTISRRQAKITLEQDVFYLEDLGSTNGTWLNNKPVVRGEKVILSDRDQVRFAEYTYDINIKKEQ